MTHNIPTPDQDHNSVTEYRNFVFGSQILKLPKMQIENGCSIYILNILGGDPLLIRNLTHDLWLAFKHKYPLYEFDGFITVEGKAIHLAYEMAFQMNKPYVVLRKSWKKYFIGQPIMSQVYQPITGSSVQSLYLDPKDLPLVADQNLIFIDDVISTGATLRASRELVRTAKGIITCCLALAIEGDCKPAIQIPHCYLAELPVERSSPMK